MPQSPRASFWAAGLARIVTRPLDERDHACGNEVVAYPPLSHSVTCPAGFYAWVTHFRVKVSAADGTTPTAAAASWAISPSEFAFCSFSDYPPVCPGTANAGPICSSHSFQTWAVFDSQSRPYLDASVSGLRFLGQCGHRGHCAGVDHDRSAQGTSSPIDFRGNSQRFDRRRISNSGQRRPYDRGHLVAKG